MKYLILLLSTSLLVLSGCTTIHEGVGEPVSFAGKWAVLPFINNTETPYAAEKAESVTAALLYARGVKNLVTIPQQEKKDEIPLGRGEERRKEAVEWARGNGVRYAMTGTVNEWRYKVGLDGEPVVGITLQVLELPGGKVVWSGTGARSGWSRESVSAVAQQIMDKLLGTIQLK